jgi:regulator of cell morphogenesis and NO signaling
VGIETPERGDDSAARDPQEAARVEVVAWYPLRRRGARGTVPGGVAGPRERRFGVLTIDRETPVAEIVTTAPATARVFERHRIDYCCAGDRPLSRAAEERGIALDVLMEEIQAAVAAPPSAPEDAAGMGIGALVDLILERHHRYVWAEWPRVEELAAKVEKAHGASHPGVVPALARLVRRMGHEIRAHLEKEEQILFPALKDLDAGRALGLSCGVGGPISVMRWEHDEHAKAFETLHRLTNDLTVPEGACPTWRALYDALGAFERDLHRHVHLENHVLFPKALARLSGGCGCEE